mgnify:CR=1 FL=1
MSMRLPFSVSRAALFVAVSGGLALTATYSYLLFHSLAEIFSVVIAWGVFMVAWNSRSFRVNNYLTFLGPAFLFVGLLDLLHALSYSGMNVFVGYDANLPTQLWIAARYVHAISFLVAGFHISRRPNLPLVLAVYGAVTGLLLLLIFRWSVFPVCFVEGQGLTPFKVYSEYAICAILAAAMIFLWHKRLNFDHDVLVALMFAMGLTIVSELVFTLYSEPQSIANGIGHWLKIAAFFFVYRALIETGLSRPYDLLFWDLKQSEEQLQHAKKLAEDASQAKDHFLAVLSHELRNPLNPVLLAVHAMRRDPAIRERFGQDLETIQRNIELEARLIDDLLDLTRVSRGKLELRRQDVDAHTLIAHALKISCSDPAEARRHELLLELRAAHSIVNADPARLQQVFWNLLINAMKFTPEGGRIIIRSRSMPGGRLRVEVEDNGIGIDPQAIGRIFSAFEQADRRITQRYGGLGLGLSISRTIVEMLGGTLTAHSAGLGAGATFILELPLAVPAPPRPADDDASDATLPPAAPAARPLQVLLVEDHADTARLMARLLESGGHEVKVAGGFTAAMELARQRRFDVLLSDLGLPDGSGLELMRQLRLRYGLRGIALSGYSMEQDLLKSREAGFDEHLTKPIDPARLETAVRRVAAGNGAGAVPEVRSM